MDEREPINLTPYEVADVLRVPIGTVRYLIRTGALTAIAFAGGHTLIERSALQDFIERHRKGGIENART